MESEPGWSESFWQGPFASLLRGEVEVQTLERAYRRWFGAEPKAAEAKSWRSMLEALQALTVDPRSFQGSLAHLERRMPHTSYRADLTVSGMDSQGQRNCVVLEYKSGKAITFGSPEPSSPHALFVGATRTSAVSQARAYQDYLAENILDPPAYLGVVWAPNSPPGDGAVTFGGGQADQLAGLLAEKVSKGPPGPERWRPAPTTLDMIGRFARDWKTPLLGEQFQALAAVRKAATSKGATTVVIEGGPGSGKTTLALRLIQECRALGKPPAVLVRSKAMNKALQGVLPLVHSSAANCQGDIVVVDEAHRLRQADVALLLQNSRVLVLLFDDRQVIHRREGWSMPFIHSFATRAVKEIKLDGTWRHGGLYHYELWMAGLLGLESQSHVWERSPAFDLRVPASLEDLEAIRREWWPHGQQLRTVYGPSAIPDFPLIGKTYIHRWEREFRPDYAAWARPERHWHEVGSVTAAQGFEFDWVIVYVDRGLRYEEGWQADRHLRAAVYTLCTRARKGVAVYFEDEGARARARSLVLG